MVGDTSTMVGNIIPSGPYTLLSRLNNIFLFFAGWLSLVLISALISSTSSLLYVPVFSNPVFVDCLRRPAPEYQIPTYALETFQVWLLLAR